MVRSLKSCGRLQGVAAGSGLIGLTVGCALLVTSLGELTRSVLLATLYAVTIIFATAYSRKQPAAIIAAGWLLLGWLYRTLNIGMTYHTGTFFEDFIWIRDNRLHRDLFPSFFSDPYVYVICVLCVPAMATATLFGSRSRAGWIVASVASLILIWHQNGFANQVFYMWFWCALFLAWLAKSDRLDNAATIAQSILSVVFLGGFVGKLTGGYWDGSVLESLNSPHYQWVRDLGSGLPNFPMWYSRSVVIGEGIIVACWLLPRRLGLLTSGIMLAVIPLTSIVNTIDAMGPLFGLAVAGYCLSQHEPDRNGSGRQVRNVSL